MKKVMITLLAGASVLSLVACAPKRYERQSKPTTATSSTVKKEKKDTGQSIIKRSWSDMLSMIQLLKMAIKQDSLRHWGKHQLVQKKISI